MNAVRWSPPARNLTFAAILVTSASCASSTPPPAETSEAKSVETAAPVPEAPEAPSFVEWLDAQYEKELSYSPMTMTMQGMKERYGDLDDMSFEGVTEKAEWKMATVQEMERLFDYDTLDPVEQVSYDVWKYQAEAEAESLKYYYDGLVYNQMHGPQSFVPVFMINFHRVDTADDMAAYISRLNQVKRGFHQLTEMAKVGVEREHVVYPAFALEAVIKECTDIITGAPFTEGEDSTLWADAKKKIAKLEEGGLAPEKARAFEAEAKEALLTSVKPAYEEIIAWSKQQMDRVPEVVSGVGSREGGAEFYTFALKNQTTSALEADEIHALGLSEVKRIRAEMDAIRKEVGFKGDLAKFFAKVRTGEFNYYPNTDEGRQQYLDDATAAIDNIREQLPDYFGLLPKAPLVVKRVEPFREQDGAAQHYFPGTPDGSRPGIYYAHLSDMTAMPKNQLEVIAYHEGIPGHHMQIAIAQELEGVPKFRTQAFFGSYTEGWALYAEALAAEMPNTYQDPYSRLGRLASELFRAIRLVVDTGLHAKGWTTEQAIEYFLANSPEPKSSVVSEVRRYVVLPGQATTYKIGMLKIQALRAEAEEALGESFSLPAFHDVVLGGGAVPLPILERMVHDWIDAESGGSDEMAAQP